MFYVTRRDQKDYAMGDTKVVNTEAKVFPQRASVFVPVQAPPEPEPMIPELPVTVSFTTSFPGWVPGVGVAYEASWDEQVEPNCYWTLTNTSNVPLTLTVSGALFTNAFGTEVTLGAGATLETWELGLPDGIYATWGDSVQWDASIALSASGYLDKSTELGVYDIQGPTTFEGELYRGQPTPALANKYYMGNGVVVNNKLYARQTYTLTDTDAIVCIENQASGTYQSSLIQDIGGSAGVGTDIGIHAVAGNVLVMTFNNNSTRLTTYNLGTSTHTVYTSTQLGTLPYMASCATNGNYVYVYSTYSGQPGFYRLDFTGGTLQSVTFLGEVANTGHRPGACGGCVLANGDVYFPPAQASSSSYTGTVIAPNGDRSHPVFNVDPFSLTGAAGSGFSNAIAIGNKVYLIPCNRPRVVVLDFDTMIATTIAIPDADSSETYKYAQGVVGYDGKIYAAPRSNDAAAPRRLGILVIDPSTDTATVQQFNGVTWTTAGFPTTDAWYAGGFIGGSIVWAPNYDANILALR